MRAYRFINPRYVLRGFTFIMRACCTTHLIVVLEYLCLIEQLYIDFEAWPTENGYLKSAAYHIKGIRKGYFF